MCDKKMQSYEIFFNLIKTTIPSWPPIKITLDFKLAINAIKKYFQK